MELGKTETFCIFNHNDGCIWHIDTDFYNGCGYKNLDLIPSKSSHDLIFFFFFHFSMQIADTDGRPKDLLKHLTVIGNIFSIQIFAFFYHRADYIALPPQFCLLPDKSVSFWTVACINHAVFDRKTVHREFIDHGNIKISVKNDSQSPWNRCCTHDENMWCKTFACELFPLSDTKAVLLICDD